MASFSDTVIDQYGRPVAGASVSIYLNGILVDMSPLPNPLTTDANGTFSGTVSGTGDLTAIARKDGNEVAFDLCNPTTFILETGGFTVGPIGIRTDTSFGIIPVVITTPDVMP